MCDILAQETPALVAFVEEAMGYLPVSAQQGYGEFLERLETDPSLPLSVKAETVKRLAMETWPIRKALAVFLEQEGAPLLYETVVNAVHPTTALLLKRLQKRTGMHQLRKLVLSPEADQALRVSEREEIALVLPEARLRVWEEQKGLLASAVQEAKRELRFMQTQFEHLWRDTERDGTEREKQILDLEWRFYIDLEPLMVEELAAKVG